MFRQAVNEQFSEMATTDSCKTFPHIFLLGFGECGQLLLNFPLRELFYNLIIKLYIFSS